MSRFQALKEEVFDGNLELVRRDLVIYTWGNVSAIDRKEGVVVIKPRGIEYSDMTADDMSVVDMDGNLVEGKLLPSVDLGYHMALYKAFEGINAVAHTHSTYATAFAQAQMEIPVYGTTHADHFYGPIPCIRHLTPEEVEKDYEYIAGDVIVEHFINNKIDPLQVCAVLCPGHGPFTWGKDVASSVEHSVILEELAKMAKFTLDLKPNADLLPKHMLDKHYLRKYGANAYFYQSK